MSEKYYLTPVELELMEILWKLEEGTVHQVMQHLPVDRHLAYTSVSTMLRILQQKNVVDIKKVGRQHIYYPLLNKKTYANHSIKKIVQQVFSGNSAELVAHLVDKNKLSLDEINALQQLLDSKKKALIK